MSITRIAKRANKKKLIKTVLKQEKMSKREFKSLFTQDGTKPSLESSYGILKKIREPEEK